MSTQQTPPLRDSQALADRLVQFYEQLAPADLERLQEYYAPDAHFRDPFNDVRGVAAIREIFAHMFTTLDAPRFMVSQALSQGHQAFLVWEFRFRMRRWQPRVEQCIHGASLLRFDSEGRIATHRDYWDAAQELYEKLPLLGGLMRWLRRAASATATTTTTDPHAHRPPP